jgi:hypothetical protein
MRFMARTIVRNVASSTLLTRLFELPELAAEVQALPAADFAALVRRIGIEDAGELLALATSEQLVTAFDEDLFTNDRPGERERFDASGLSVWLEVLLEAGDARAAARVAELSEDFVAHALSTMVLVFEESALREALGDEDDDDALRADKALESALSEELDGYVIVARRPDGWDAVLALVLGLDRDHRPYLERVLDRLVRVSSGRLDDLDELATVLDEGASLAEDAEAEREDRRAKQGYVEPRMAKSFLALARDPGANGEERDAVTRAYLRELERSVPRAAPTGDSRLAALVQAVRDSVEPGDVPPLEARDGRAASGLVAPMRKLAASNPQAFDARTEELAFLTNVLVAAAEGREGRMRPLESAMAVMATVELGARLVLEELWRRGAVTTSHADSAEAQGSGLAQVVEPAEVTELAAVLAEQTAERLFRRACAELVRRDGSHPGFVRNAEELTGAVKALGLGHVPSPRAR